MRALIINCSPVRTGATAEIVKLVSELCGGNDFITLCDGNGREEVEDYSAKLLNQQDQYERFMKRKEKQS
ncbi:MAG: hypothetical protein K6B69_15645 [Lachnospiraceae bacterium]|nr:hypothetical protein [Lachnospiraceae bacterium]